VTTEPGPPGQPGDGLQPERTALAWSRASLGVLGNGVLVLVRDLHGDGGPLRFVLAGLAAIVAAWMYAVGVRRQRLLRRRPLPARLVPRREVRLVGAAVLTLIAATALLLPL
jgi:uncharacterized membrane protein YidH (DUF202 family)